MMNSQKYLKTISIFFSVILFVTFIDGCKKEVSSKKYIAKVNDSYLTEDELDSIYNSSSGIQYKNEIIRNWINRELLYQEAERQGVLNNKNFKRILEDSKKELAASFLLKNYSQMEKSAVEPAELEKYYNDNADEFKLIYDSYLLNLITFNSEDKALKFRSEALEKNWNNALHDLKNDTSVFSEKSRDLLYEYEIQPISVLRVVKELYPSEISIVLNNEADKYIVVQLIEKFNKGDIPPFDLIQNNVKNVYLMQKKELTIKDYIKELYSKNDIEVKN
jgi:PPIC-type PPIASE domain